MRRPRIRKSHMRLRTGVSQTIIAEIGPRRRIVGLVGLHAVSDIVTADGSRGHRNNGAVVIVLVIIVALRVVARPIIVTRPTVVAVALRRDRAADHSTGNRAGDKPAAAAAIASTVAAAITAATDTITAASAAEAGRWSATAATK